MNASYVEQNQIIDRYLLGKLSEQQAEEFEVLCLHDPVVLDQLELSEKMLAGFRRADEQNTLQEIHPKSVVKRSLKNAHVQSASRTTGAFPVWHYATAASLLVGICMFSLVSVFSQRDIPSSVYDPQINTSIFELTRTRSAAADPDMIVRISAQPEWLVFAMNLDTVDYERYRATLLAQDRSVVWQSDGLLPNYQDSLTVSLNSTQLAEGDFRIEIDGLTDTDATRIEEYAFRVRLRE